MLIYFVLIAIIVLLYYFINKTKWSDSIKRNNFVWISAVLFLLLFGLRDQSMGIDVGTYINSFEEINKMTLGQVLSNPNYIHFEPGFVILNKLIGSISLDANFYLFCISLICIVFVFVVIQKHSSNALISVLVWMCCGHFLFIFSALRQAIAISICLYSMSLLWDKHPIKFMIGVLFACLFHKSSAITLVVFIPYLINNSRGLKAFYTMCMVVAYVVIFLFPKEIVTFAMSLMGKTYNPASSNDGTGLMSLVYFVIYIFALLTHNQKDKKSELLINMYAFAIVAQAFSRAHSLAGRIAVYFEILGIILIPVLLCECNLGEINPKPVMSKYITADNYKDTMTNTPRCVYIDGAVWSKLFVVICFLCLGLYQIANIGWAEANPYIFFWA